MDQRLRLETVGRSETSAQQLRRNCQQHDRYSSGFSAVTVEVASLRAFCCCVISWNGKSGAEAPQTLDSDTFLVLSPPPSVDWAVALAMGLSAINSHQRFVRLLLNSSYKHWHRLGVCKLVQHFTTAELDSCDNDLVLASCSLPQQSWADLQIFQSCSNKVAVLEEQSSKQV